MKSLWKQGLMIVVVVVAIALLRHRVPPTVPMPPTKDIHGQSIQIAVQTKPSETLAENWQLIQLPDKKYQVIVRYKGQIKGKFTTTVKQSNDATGQTFIAVGPVQFGSESYAARNIHVNPDGTSGYIVFYKTQTAGSAVSNR